MKTLILFDVDGTLIHSNRNDSLSFAETYEELFERPFPTIDWRRYPHVTDTTILNAVLQDHFGRACSPGEVRVFQDRYIARMQRKRKEDASPYREVPFARETVERLIQDPAYQVGIATGGWKAPAHFKLRHLAFPVDDLTLVGADEKLTREDILGEAIRLSGNGFSRIVYVGDALWDVRTTYRMKLNFIGIRVKGDLELLQQQGVSHVFRDFSSFQAFEAALQEALPPGLPGGDLPEYTLF
jgi:phosphoglycolate phosphatase-like HAD superfamily hydrolase